MQSIIYLLVIVVSVWIYPAYAVDTYDLLEEIAETISNKHITKPTKKDFSTIIPDAVNKYLQSIDPHSKYLSVKEYQRFKKTKDDGYVGIGAKLIDAKQGIILVPFFQGPAFKAGIKTHKLLLSVNAIPIEAMKVQKILTLLKGNKNSSVMLETQSLFAENEIPRLNRVIRQLYHLPSVQVVSGNFHSTYIRINKFISRKTLNSLKTALQNNDSPIISIDLRETSGGDLYETLDCLSLFLPSQKLLLTTLNNKDQQRSYYSLPRSRVVNQQQIILMVGPRTASSAEIFAKALQYYQKAVLVGQETYGKCMSQTYIELTDGSALKLSNLKLLYPDGTFCAGKGLIPNILVDDKQLYNPKALISKGKGYFSWRN